MENYGSLMIIGGRDRKKHEKRLDDSRLSLTLIRIENAAGNEGSWIFLYKRKSNPKKSLSDLSLVTQHGALVGSHCHPTTHAYFTDDAWIELSTIIAKGIIVMPVIRDHKDWWVSFSLYEFGSHVNVDATNENFNKLNIWIVKEEVDTSQTCQSYDQLQAKENKSRMCPLVDIVASKSGVINQWQLIILFLQASKKGKPSDWIVSFKIFNMHPKHRVKFSDWLIKISSVLQNSDAAFRAELECARRRT